MGKSGVDEKILSYNDVVLRQSDLEILGGPYFLNDRIIEFYFSYLSSCYPTKDVLLVPPSIAFWIMNCPVVESLKEFLEPLHFPDKKLVIFPVNDNDDVSKAEGGSHWSLVAFEKNSNVFIHHDSFKGVNKQHAKRLFDAVVGYMGVSNSAPAATYLESNDSPQQVNGYDCGLYVTAIARAICSWHESAEDKEGDDLWFSVVKQQVEPSSVATMRDEILSKIRGLMATE